MVMSSIAQVTDYLGDLAKHYFCFWKENSEKVCDDEEDIEGKVVIVTGCNTGIGKMIALELAKRGAIVIMAVRDLGKGKAAMEEIKNKLEGTGRTVNMELMKLDLGNLQSVRDFVNEFEAKHPTLDILCNNAGFMDTNGVAKKTIDGFEQHIGVNHLGPFLLTRLLLKFCKKNGSSPPRIVCVASSNLALVPLNSEDILETEKVKTGDSGIEQYSVSKMMNAVCIVKLATTIKEDLRIVQLCPGYVKSDVFRNVTGFFNKLRNTISLGAVGLTTHQGAETAVFCSVSKSVVEKPDSGKGEIYRFMKIWERGNKLLMDLAKTEEAEKLYKMSEELVGLREKELTVKKADDGNQ